MASRAPRQHERRVTASDVARLAGVSPATVSYVLNDAPGQTIPESTRARVKAAAAKLSYVPSAAATSLRRGHSQIVIVVTEPALLGFAADTFLRAASDRLSEAGLMPLTHQYTSDDALLALCDAVRPFGVIALTSHRGELMDDLGRAGVPHVYSSAHGDPAYPRPWEEEIGEAQAEHLLERGYRRLVYARPDPANPRTVMARSRELGAARAAARAGVPALQLLEVTEDLEQTARVLSACLSPTAPTGICAFDDDVAAEVLAALRTLDVGVPEDAGVVGVDDAPFARFLTPSLTTVSLDMRRTGRSLAERFLGVAAADERVQPPRSHARIVSRGSA